MSDLPAGWRHTTLGELAAPEQGAITDGPFGSNLTSAHYSDVGARVIRLENIGDGYFRDARSFVPLEHFQALRKHEAKPGDLIVASLGDNLPRACLLPDLGVSALVKADCIRIRLGSGVHPKWALYSLQAPQAKEWAQDRLRGVGRQRLGLKGIRDIPVVLPPLEDQQRIVSVLEDLFSRLAAARSYAAAGAARAQSLLQVCRDALTSDGPAMTLEDVLAVPLRNGHSARAASDGATRTLTLTAVTTGVFEDRHTKLTAADPKRVAALWLKSGDILVQRSNTPELVGTSALYRGPDDWAIFPDLLIRVRVDQQRVRPAYAAMALSSTGTRSRFRRLAKGLAGSMPKIDQAAIGSTTLCLPSLRAQDEAVEQFEDIAAIQRRLSASCTAAVAREQHLRRCLLQAATRGDV